ncbi:MAG: 50S ribosomal protein L24 [Lachnospiraceae bacterium]|jgi:large subunit ribosomal protein L24|nr:50S ribosomal protein L24 [Lachnospiraceae bacterium]SFT48295.1 large subunit ribosomal protein L24 [Lachnospiraceae bacterium XBD2001]MBP5299475.1 50S ribosomal protein L24 [Lachnospiraceae bacterium]MBQ1607772.1 50S ribosomal protein L24 [Lachnospiraceae bacterium]MBQ2318363.1 50S ribosomal protein L24 [Lachnospiraceae bacterium]
MASSKIKKGDMVRVIAGTSKNSEGKVIAVDNKNHKVTVEGVHMIKKHVKPSMANQAGGIVEQEGPIDISNVMLLEDGKTTRVGFKMDGDKKVRYSKKTGNVIK